MGIDSWMEFLTILWTGIRLCFYTCTKEITNGSPKKLWKVSWVSTYHAASILTLKWYQNLTEFLVLLVLWIASLSLNKAFYWVIFMSHYWWKIVYRFILRISTTCHTSSVNFYLRRNSTSQLPRQDYLSPVFLYRNVPVIRRTV